MCINISGDFLKTLLYYDAIVTKCHHNGHIICFKNAQCTHIDIDFFRNAALRGWGSLQFVKGLPKMIKRMSLQSPFFLDKVCYFLLLFCVVILTISGLYELLDAITSHTYPGRLIGWLVSQWACLAVLFFTYGSVS